MKKRPKQLTDLPVEVRRPVFTLTGENFSLQMIPFESNVRYTVCVDLRPPHGNARIDIRGTMEHKDLDAFLNSLSDFVKMTKQQKKETQQRKTK